MKKVFVQGVQNVKNFNSATKRLLSMPEGAPRMGLIFSDPGFGKTKTVANYIAHNSGIVVRAKFKMTSRWLLDELVKELGESPQYSTMNLFHQAVELLMLKRCPIFIDEVDHLCHEGIVEILRDLADTTFLPVIFIGMGSVDKKLMRFKHLYARFGEIVRFNPLSKEDVGIIVKDVCETEISDDGVDFINSKINGNFRGLTSLVLKAERINKVNGVKLITTKELSA